MSIQEPRGTKSGSDTVLLDSLAQVGKRREFTSESTVQEAITRWQKRAKQKRFSIPYHIQLAELRNAREQQYRNAIYCAHRLVQEADGRIRTNYCNGRLCPICHAIRTARAMNRYVPLIEEFTDPYFLTLTRQTVPAGRLRETVGRMIEEFSRSNRTLARQGIKVHGLRKLEITYNQQTNRFHPHFHCIVEGEKEAEAIRTQWLKRHQQTASLKWQRLQRIVCGDTEALRNVFGYVTKLITVMENDSVPVPAESLDVIVAALYKRKTLQAYGNLYRRGNDTERPIDSEPIPYVSPAISRIGEQMFWEWVQEAGMWVDRQTGELLIGSE